MTGLNEALLAAQKAMPAVQKDSINPHFRNRYVSLDSLLPPVLAALNKSGIVLTQFPTGIDTGSGVLPALRTRLTHAETGEWIEDTMLLMSTKDDPQNQGSALTYARRYALMSILGLVADEDDDGTRVSHEKSAGDGAPTASPTPSPAEVARAAQEANRVAPEDDGAPENVICTFGKHKGERLGDIPGGYLDWIVKNYEAKNVEQRRIVEAAAILTGAANQPEVFDDDIPF